MRDEKKWPEVMTAPEAAQYLRVDIRSVWKLLSEGKIRGARVGRVWRIAKSELDRFLRGGEAE
ncbi:MAG: helix-turn-helix domain-containing protein [Firmicutes bacterium]|nr:helix-turn-helix domain-containing protein [Bacillota bacterium]